MDTVKIITEGGPADATKISGFHLMEVAFRFQNFGQAAVLGIIMIVVISVLGEALHPIDGKGGHVMQRKAWQLQENHDLCTLVHVGDYRGRVSILPILWIALSSLKVSTNMFSMPPQFFFKPELDTYRYMFQQAGFGKFLINSLVASVCSTLIALFLGSLGGYALSRGQFKRQKDISFWIISTRMAPIPAVILPLYLIFSACASWARCKVSSSPTPHSICLSRCG